jgi:hypothetical protein
MRLISMMLRSQVGGANVISPPRWHPPSFCQHAHSSTFSLRSEERYICLSLPFPWENRLAPTAGTAEQPGAAAAAGVSGALFGAYVTSQVATQEVPHCGAESSVRHTRRVTAHHRAAGTVAEAARVRPRNSLCVTVASKGM